MKRCNECSKQYSQMNKNSEGGCTPPVIQINNDPGCVLFHKVVFPASVGDDTTNPPSEFIGKYKNVLLVYEANNRSYMFSSDGMYTQLNNGVTDYEEATNLPQINGNTLIGDKTGAELWLQDKLTAGTNIQIDSDNVISATDTTYGPATDEAIGLVKPGDGLSVQVDGTLDIANIEEYAHFFDSVADMKVAENLIDGSYARTLGYHSKNDGGAGLYKIRNITNDDVVDEALIIEVGDGSDELIAELVASEYNFNQFGCYGDGTHDDTTNFQKCITAGIANKKNIKGVSNCVYLVSDTITVDNANIDFNNATIKANTEVTDLLKINVQDNTNFSDYYGILENAIIDCTNSTNGLHIQLGRKKLIRNCKFINITNTGLYYQSGYEVTVKDCHFIAVGSADGGASTDSIGIKATGGDSEFMDIVLINCFTAIDNGGFNMYRGIHAWIRTHSIAPNARMFNMHGNVGALISQCYSDTYGTTFNMEDAYASIDQLYVYFNSTIYENTYTAPKLFNNSQSKFTDYYQRQTSITNSTLQGVSSSQKLTYIANSDAIGVKSNYNNLKNVYGYNSYYRNASLTDKSDPSNATIDASKIWVKNGFVNINLVFHINTTVSKSFILGDLPAWALPQYEYNGMCCYGNNNISDVDGVGYLKIYDNKIRGNVKNATANTAYVKVNITYPILSEYTGS